MKTCVVVTMVTVYSCLNCTAIFRDVTAWIEMAVPRENVNYPTVMGRRG